MKRGLSAMTAYLLATARNLIIAKRRLGKTWGRMSFENGNKDGRHYWITPSDVYWPLQEEFKFTFDPCPFPLPNGFDGLTCEWGRSNYVNPPFGSIMKDGKKCGPTAWARKAILEQCIGKILRHGYEGHNPKTPAILNRIELERELGDIFAAVDIMISAEDLFSGNIGDYRARKAENVWKYMHHNKPKKVKP